MGLFDEQISRKPDNYPWAKEMTKQMHSGHWTVHKFDFTSDLHDFKINCNDEVREIITKTLSAISQIEVAVKKFWGKLGDNLPQPAMVDLGYVMANIEVIHNEAYEKLLEILDLNHVFEENLKNPIIAGRVNYLRKHLSKVYEDDKKQYIYSIILFTLFVENVSLFSQFYIINWFFRYRRLFKDTSQQTDYTIREECYIDGTEVLTPTGWRKISEMSINDDIYQYNYTKIEKTKVLSVTKKQYNGDLYKLYTKGGECLVTENHEIVYYNKAGHKKTEAAKDFKGNIGRYIPRAGIKAESGVDDLSIEDRIKIAIQADGAIARFTTKDGVKHIRGKKRGYNYIIRVKKDRKKKRLLELLSKSSLKYSIKTSSKEDHMSAYIYIPSEYDLKTFDWVDLSDKSSKWCEEFVQELLQWDGAKHYDGSVYCNTKKDCIDIAQHVAILAGYKTNISVNKDSEKKNTYHNCYKLYLVKKDFLVRTHGLNKEKIPYSGEVSCVSVPSGVIITRYKDKVFFGGNCSHFQAGAKIINTLRIEYPQLFDKGLEDKIYEEAKVALECEEKVIDWMIGSFKDERIDANILKNFVRFKLNEGLVGIGYKPIFEVDPAAERDFEWFIEQYIGVTYTDTFFKHATEYTKSSQPFNEWDLW